MIICICRNIRSADLPDNITQKEYEKYISEMKCGMCQQNFKTLIRKTNK